MLTKVKLIDKLGSDKTVVNAARVSFNKEISEMKPGSILVIDEIGRMELNSEKFQNFIIKLFNEPRYFKLLVTIPIKREDI